MNDFLSQVTAIIDQNLANEHFSVSELADATNMSRSNLLRKVKKETKLSVSQLINQVRLKRAMELLRTSASNVSEVSHQVGFNSPSYFIKCFREYYGYPPGEVGKRPETESLPPVAQPRRKAAVILTVAGLLILAVVAGYFIRTLLLQNSEPIEKSIAVLPFKNESNDSTNIYLINGLMENTLGNLQKIKDLRVISRTSSEKYRNTSKSVPEMAKELNVNYFVEGSGQKIGDQIVVNIQLIEAVSDRHLWSNQYKRETKDIFQLQQEIAKNIADEIKAIITPDEKKRIEKKPTDNLVAYDLFLRARNMSDAANGSNDEKAIALYDKAIEVDPKFALAYAEVAIRYYYMDVFKSEKKFVKEISKYADKAMLYDPKLGESLIAKALDYLSRDENESALPYLEKALEDNPNSAMVIAALSDYYTIYKPEAGKYLEYALKGVQLDVASQDSITASYTYLRLGNALIQNGFVDEALMYLSKSFDFNKNNPWSKYIIAFTTYAKTNDAKLTRDLLLVEFNKDTSRFDILQDIGKISYFMRDYKGAFRYYKRFLRIRESRQLNAYRHENLIIAFVLAHEGETAKAQELVKDYKEFNDSDKSIYKHLGLCSYFCYTGDKKQAVEQMKLFSLEDNVQYWIILFAGGDPILGVMKDNKEFQKYFNVAKKRFWKNHDLLSNILKEKGLLQMQKSE